MANDVTSYLTWFKRGISVNYMLWHSFSISVQQTHRLIERQIEWRNIVCMACICICSMCVFVCASIWLLLVRKSLFQMRSIDLFEFILPTDTLYLIHVSGRNLDKYIYSSYDYPHSGNVIMICNEIKTYLILQ